MADWIRSPQTNEDVRRILSQLTSMTAEEFAALSDDLRRAAFTMAKVHDAAVLNRILVQMRNHIRAGWSPEAFASWLESNGVEWSRAYSRLVYRNATQNAYNLARWRIMNRAGNVRRYPVIEYDATLDNVTSDFCRSYDGRWWYRTEFPRSLVPPNHHNCRSRLRMRTKAVAERKMNRRLVGSEYGTPEFSGAPPDGWHSALGTRRRYLEAGLGIGG